MGSREKIDFRGKRTDLFDSSAVRSLVILEDHLADRLLLILIYRIVDQRQPVFMVSELLGKHILDLRDIGFSCLLVVGENSLFHLLRRYKANHLFVEFFRNHIVLVITLLLAALFYDLIDEFDNLAVHLMCLVDRLDHLVLRHFIGTGFDHDDLLTGGSNRQHKVGYGLLLIGRIDDELTVNHADLSHGARTCKRNIGNAGCNGRAEHGCQLRAGILVNAQNEIVQCDIISVILREKRTHRTVNDTCGENRILAGLALSLVKASRDLSYGIHLLFKINAEREEVDALSRFIRGSCC